MFEESKPWWQSRSMIGSLVAALSILANNNGFAIDAGLENEISDVVFNVTTLLGAITSLMGRILATKKLS